MVVVDEEAESIDNDMIISLSQDRMMINTRMDISKPGKNRGQDSNYGVSKRQQITRSPNL